MSFTLNEIILAKGFYLIKQGGSQRSSGEPHSATEGHTAIEDTATAEKTRGAHRREPLRTKLQPRPNREPHHYAEGPVTAKSCITALKATLPKTKSSIASTIKSCTHCH